MLPVVVFFKIGSMAKYSIITPQFNSFELMDKYFDSLLNQTVRDFEVVIVDDCSTDGSWKKLQEYVRQSPLQITLLQAEKNSGPGNARNMGIEAAKGEWITFVDNDDWVARDFLEKIDAVKHGRPSQVPGQCLDRALLAHDKARICILESRVDRG